MEFPILENLFKYSIIWIVYLFYIKNLFKKEEIKIKKFFYLILNI